MKTKLFALILLLAPFMSFAQGKVGFVNDSLHLFVLADAQRLSPSDAGLANQPIPSGPLPSGITLVAGLYAGTSSASLTLQSSTTLLTGTGLPQPGRMASRNTILSIPGGVPQWFQIAIWDASAINPSFSPYIGFSPLFQCTPGTSITYPSIMPGGPSASTLPATLNIAVGYPIPEPTSAALLLLGALVLHFSARRHNRPN